MTNLCRNWAGALQEADEASLWLELLDEEHPQQRRAEMSHPLIPFQFLLSAFRFLFLSFSALRFPLSVLSFPLSVFP
jgi:hypothetical protein